jgi:hypothetical protein
MKTILRCLVRRSFRHLLLLAAAGAGLSSAPAADSSLLWEIGKPDNNNAEFALAPKGYAQFREDGFFVVGKSDPKKDWPYVHPGPDDAWAGGRPHVFTIFFGLKAAPTLGDCTLKLDFLDTQGRSAPRLKVAVNGQVFQQQMPPGGGDASIFGDPAKGKEHKWDLAFPANQLKAGANEITITTLSGSWMLYDTVGLETPAGLELAEVTGTVAGQAQSPPTLVEREGKLMQTVQMSIRHFGAETPATVRVGEAAPVQVQLRQAAQKVEALVPAVEKETPVAVTVEVGGKVISTQDLTLKPVRKWVVYLLPHSHVDIGYTHVQTDVEKAQWKYLEMGIEAARRSATNPVESRFKWNVEVMWAVDSYLKQATPEKQQQFVEAVKLGQVGLQALYGNELTGLCSPEELLRLISSAQRVAQRCGVALQSAMITDVPGYTWGIVPAFAQNGVKYFSIGPNGGDRIGHTIEAWGDKPFWWLGPNGKDKVLVWMTGTGYYQVFSSPQKLTDYLSRLEEKGYPYDFVQVRHCLGDNGAPDLNFADKIKAWNDTHAYPKLIIATTDTMFRDFEQRYGDKIPTAQGDFTPYWEDGAASSALETAMNRGSANRLVQAEALYSLYSPEAYPAAEFEQAWRNVILYDEHTWGAHNSISQPDAPFAKSQWAIKRQFAVDGDAQSRKLITAANDSRGAAPEVPAGVQAIDAVNTSSYSLPWTLVTIPKELSAVGDGISYPSSSAISRSQRLTTGELVFRPCQGGYRAARFFIGSKTSPFTSSPPAMVEGLTLSAPRSALAPSLTVRLDEQTGGIVSLRYGDREYVNPKAGTALNDYFYLPGSDIKKLQRNGPVKISVKEKGPLIASLLVESEAPGCRKLTREVRIHALRNYVEIINTVDKAPVRAKEGVHFGFGFNVPEGVVRMEVPWGVVRPELDQIPGACKNWFTVQQWVDVSNDKFGVTLLTPDAPLMQVGGITANLIGSLSDTRAWLNKIEPSQTLYSWAMNNHWHTNYRAEQEGPTVFRYYLFPHEDGYSPEFASRVAREISQPLVVLPARGPASELAPFYVYPAAVQVTCYKPSEDGKAEIVRLFNPTEKPLSASLNWTANTNRPLWLSDAGEQPLRRAGTKIEVPAKSIITVRAER